MVSAHVGNRRCEGSQSRGQSSWTGLKGTGKSQGGHGPTFPVKSGKHGQSQGTGVHISSPTFEANPLVPTTPLDDTINMQSPRPWGPPEPQRTLRESTSSSQVKSAPPAPGLTRGGAGRVSFVVCPHNIAPRRKHRKHKQQRESVRPSSSRLPFLAMAVHPSTAGIVLETWFRHEPHNSRCNSRPPACHHRRPNNNGSNASAPSYAVLLPELFLTGWSRPECRDPALNVTMIRCMLTASHSAGMQRTHTNKVSLRHSVPLGKFVSWWDATSEIARVHLDNQVKGAHQVTAARYLDSKDRPNHPNGT